MITSPNFTNATRETAERVRTNGRYSVRSDPVNGLDYEQRETLKEEATAVLAQTDYPMHVRAQALQRWIEAHYWRARERLEASSHKFQRRVHGKRYCPGYELDIDVYTRHWLAAVAPQIAEQDVVAYIVAEFGYQPEMSRFLPRGHSYYCEPQSDQ
jgi:hypothetical protein